MIGQIGQFGGDYLAVCSYSPFVGAWSLEAFRALGSRALKSEGSELFFDCQKLYGRNRYHHT